jgi:hypothetical protein
MAKITFTDTYGLPDEFKPKPSIECIPEWYKTVQSYMTDDLQKKPTGNGMTTGTIKKCMPVFDSITSGYIIPTYSDVYVSQKKVPYGDLTALENTGESIPLTDKQIEEKGLAKTYPWYEWPLHGLISFHPIGQAPNHPHRNGHEVSYPKWMNPWAIKTPPGYSTLFIQPVHRESVFTILPGIVDTDKYDAPINFPFVLNDVSYEGTIPAGTPMVQVIPFKRDSWTMTFGGEEELKNQTTTSLRLRSRIFDAYKNLYRTPKEYK